MAGGDDAGRRLQRDALRSWHRDPLGAGGRSAALTGAKPAVGQGYCPFRDSGRERQRGIFALVKGRLFIAALPAKHGISIRSWMHEDCNSAARTLNRRLALIWLT